MSLKTNLDFENKETKILLSKLDMKYFLLQNSEEEKYSEQNIKIMDSTYADTIKELKIKSKKQSSQFYYYLEGQTRKMFTGGFLPAMFHLDEGRRNTIFDFKEVGKSWALFKMWQTRYKRKITGEKIWSIVIKVGSVLGIILSILKILELF